LVLLQEHITMDGPRNAKLIWTVLFRESNHISRDIYNAPG